MANYIATDVELTAIANAIREKGGTSAPLTFPAGFVSAVEDIPTGGGSSETENAIIDRSIQSYTNSTVSFIGRRAFSFCPDLLAVSFPAAEIIDTQAFEYCYSLISVDAKNVTEIRNGAFQGCSYLIEANFPKVSEIGSYAFSGCTLLDTAIFPEATIINSTAFTNCKNLQNISFPKAVTVGNSAFYGCSQLIEAVFPALEEIGASAFSSCASLAMASFPALKRIASSAFYKCFKLVSLYLLGSSVVTLDSFTAFTSTPIGGYINMASGQYGSIFVPSSLYDTYISATGWSTYRSRFVGV